MRFFSRKIILAVFLAAPALSGLSQQNKVTITIKNIRSDTGVIRIGIYNNPVQFPQDPVKCFTLEKTMMIEGTMEIVLIDISPGSYAISLLDDEDGNERMKYNFLRMPREGYGFSNNVKPGLKSPPFEKCSIQIGKGNTHLNIKMQYFRE